jgi:choline dehydrogenase-like flavoprotein
VNINNLKEQNTYDAIVIGSGISGGLQRTNWKGLNVLMLERGMNVEIYKDYDQQWKPLGVWTRWEINSRAKGPILYKLEIIRIRKLMRNGG